MVLESSTVPQEPKGIPLLPLRGLILFPKIVTPLEVGRPRSLLAIERANAQDQRIVLAAQKDARMDTPSPDDIYTVEILAEIKQVIKVSENQLKVLIEGLERVRIDKFLSVDPFYQVEVTTLELDPADAVVDDVLRQAALRQFEQYNRTSRRLPTEVLVHLSSIDDANELADALAANLPVDVAEKQNLLEIVKPAERLEHICTLLMRESEILEMQRKIHMRVRQQMEKSQKEYYLREQMKAIQNELGEDDERSQEIEEFRRRLKQAKLPEQAREKVEREIARLEKMPSMAAESVVVRNYIDWMLSLPWSKTTKDRIDIDKAREILDADHYGLEKVKERILEFLAVRKLVNKMNGPILCLVGPPGVGKTSLAKSVAQALGRKFVRFSLGGVRDEAEIRGHRRTYVGAMPGRIIQAMREAGTRNPVILLDEIDKMTMDFRGDPSAALLEVLDPEQNHNFGDHYLEVPFDLSDVFFVTTANVLSAIPRPLADRMEIIELSSYTEEEKLAIARRHLLPKQLEQHGLRPEQLNVSDNAIREIIRSYTREAGVRNLERQLAALCRKAAMEAVRNPNASMRVRANHLEKYLGQPRRRYNKAEKEPRVGVATGLAYTSVGGDILPIEAVVLRGKGNLLLTGKLGEVMRESAQAAVSYIRSRYAELRLDEKFHETCDIHIHVPEGAVPKDGPSAGIAIAVAVASALTGRTVDPEVAMTGEITLRGTLLPIGGVKEKVLAAHRAGIKTVLLPVGNEQDLAEIPPQVRQEINCVLLENMDEVLLRVLGPRLNESVSAVVGEAAATLEEPDVKPFLPPRGDAPTPWMEENTQ